MKGLKVKTLKVTSLLLTLLLALGAFTGCYWLWYRPDEATLTVVEDPKLTAIYNEEEKCYDVEIEGLLQNEEDFAAFANITIVIYDADGNSIASVYDSMDQIQAGSRWHYCIRTTTIIQPYSCSLVELYGSEIL
jgi:hypothetical protein